MRKGICMKYVLVTLGFVFSFVGGFYLTISSKEFPFEYVEYSPGKLARDPAAIRRSHDFSNLQGVALNQALKDRIVSDLKLVRNSHEVGVELGHFVIRSADGAKEFACQRYDNVTLVFEGDGSAIAGELPKMEVQGACVIGSDINKMQAIMIPFQRILGEPAGDGELEYTDQASVKMKFQHISERWPKAWRLKSVYLSDKEQQSADVILNEADLAKGLSQPLILEF